MAKNVLSLEESKRDIDNSLTSVTKCYILLNYAEIDKDTEVLYKEEFSTRYINFYKTVNEMENSINEVFTEDSVGIIKHILDIDYYDSEMEFLRLTNFDAVKENNEQIDVDYIIKASMSNTKLNFFNSNREEFGENTRFHIDTDKYTPIDPVAKSNNERKCIFETLTKYYKENFFKKNKTLKKDMQ